MSRENSKGHCYPKSHQMGATLLLVLAHQFFEKPGFLAFSDARNPGFDRLENFDQVLTLFVSSLNPVTSVSINRIEFPLETLRTPERTVR